MRSCTAESAVAGSAFHRRTKERQISAVFAPFAAPTRPSFPLVSTNSACVAIRNSAIVKAAPTASAGWRAPSPPLRMLLPGVWSAVHAVAGDQFVHPQHTAASQLLRAHRPFGSLVVVGTQIVLGKLRAEPYVHHASWFYARRFHCCRRPTVERCDGKGTT
jgi:hypothetical protein